MELEYWNVEEGADTFVKLGHLQPGKGTWFKHPIYFGYLGELFYAESIYRFLLGPDLIDCIRKAGGVL